MKSTERRIYFYDIVIDVNKKGATPPPMRAVITAIEERFKEGKVKLPVNNETAMLEIGDMDVRTEEGYALLLVRISDRTAPDAYFSNPEKGSSRVARKEEGEGRGSGAHLLISLNEDRDRPHTYLTLLEKNTWLHRSHVNRLLQGVLRELYQQNDSVFTCDHVAGLNDRHRNPKKVNFRPMLTFTGHPSQTLIEELEAGVIKEISLIHDEQQTELGGRPWLKKQETVLKLKATTKDPIRNAWNEIKNVIGEQGKEGYEKARIKFKTKDGEIEVVEVESATGNTLMDDKYVKSLRVTGIEPPLDESADHIVEHFRIELMKLLEVQARAA